MRKTANVTACLALLALCAGALVAAEPAQPTQGTAPPAQSQMPPMSPEMQAEMAEWMKMGTPGKEHEQLAAMAGTWKASGRSFMTPDGTPFEGTIHRKTMFGNRILEEHFSADMMGMAFEGHGLGGYDNARKQYWLTWNDNMSTGVLVAYGRWDDAAKGIVYDGEITDPKGQPLKVRVVTRHPTPTTEEFEYWETRGGKMTKTMAMTLTKQ